MGNRLWHWKETAPTYWKAVEREKTYQAKGMTTKIAKERNPLSGRELYTIYALERDKTAAFGRILQPMLYMTDKAMRKKEAKAEDIRIMAV